MVIQLLFLTRQHAGRRHIVSPMLVRQFGQLTRPLEILDRKDDLKDDCGNIYPSRA